ncbi:Arylsulphatase [Hyaloscypha bicolor E]|uniref:Arylsulfatase n=1 Tax=Hyaloscypha bicolor E TaxID=1095630 RepID=A0A2J6SNQ6_9HELO|nr:Arylsulphatase [Hyaloscypha bicolor E]PMD52394.1 Arylsulphatase [Hyaloscypha bicolor E]
MKLFLGLVTVLVTAISGRRQQPIAPNGDGRANIVVILTDDQDLHMDSVDYMPLLKKQVIDHGTFYKHHYCSTAICCPSRVTLWTGRNAHNTNVTDVFPPYGGYPKFVAQGFNRNWLPLWLQAAGYSTYYTGKLFNAHTIENWNSPHPAGWTSSDFLLDPHTYQYLNASFQRNQYPPVSHEGQYSTDVLAGKAYGLLEEGVQSGKPFFLTVAPMAPHSNVDPFPVTGTPEAALKEIRMTAPISAERHKHLFPDVKVPRRSNFNPEKPGGASWIKRLAKLTDEVIEYNDDFYRARLQTLQAVDELVEGVVTRLEDAGILHNTYIFYTTDNGYHISQHRLNPGKECGFEEDINIPLIVRGPGVPVGESQVVTAQTDLAPTFLKIAGAKWGWDGLDGSPVPLNKKQLENAKKERQEHVNVEFWGRIIPEGKHRFSLDDGKIVDYGPNNTYKALRVVGPKYNLYYSVWCTNEHELYDLTTDPGQLNNIYPTSSSESEITILGVPVSKLLPRLDTLLMVTKSCKGRTCVQPWSVIHPAGNVKTLHGALNKRYDSFYASVSASVSFEKCELGYILESEGPQEAVVFHEGLGNDWLANGEL